MTSPDRRQFLAAAALTPAALAADAPKRAPVVDTHLHCFAGPRDARFPYHAKAPYRPDAPATPEQLLRCMDGAAVDFAVVVHPEPYQDDHSYLEHCLEVGKGRLKGTCLVFTDRPGAPEKVRDLAKRLPVVAARVHAYAPERLPPFGKPELRALWKAAADVGLAVQLHFEPRYAPGFEELIKEFAGTTVLVDHLGRPFQGTPAEYDRVVGWSRFPNVVMKLSAVPSAKSYPHRDPAPEVKRLTEAFGADRLMYGGGFDAQATPESYRAERERLRALLGHLPAADQEKILGGTAAKLFRFAA